jgi:hypothetical protein
MEVTMGLFSIKSRSDSSHHPPYSNLTHKNKEKNIIVVPESGNSAEVSISDFLKARIKQKQLIRKKSEKAFILLEIVEIGLKDIRSVIETEKDLNEAKKIIENICENTTFEGKKLLDNKEGHQEFLKYFPDFEIEAEGECKFAPNLSPSCLKIANGFNHALECVLKHEKLVQEKKESILNTLGNNQKGTEVSSLIKKITDDLSNNQELGIKSQADSFTQELLKII